jgi:hypothetical protein
MNWQIPHSPIIIQILTVPPIEIELPVSKVENLRQYIQQTMEKYKENDNPTISVRQGQFQQPFNFVPQFSVIRIEITDNRFDKLYSHEC